MVSMVFKKVNLIGISGDRNKEVDVYQNLRKTREEQMIQQWRCQNFQKVTHIKGRLLYQAMFLYNYAPFRNGNYSLRKEFAPRGSEFFPLRAVP